MDTINKNITQKPAVLYHFTSLHNLVMILHAGHLALSGSNLNAAVSNVDVVWLTSSPFRNNHGLGETDNAIFDKQQIRITVKHKPSFKLWDEWSNNKGMDKVVKDTLISTANAKETHKTWYISEEIIPFADIIKIENIMSGAEIPIPSIALTQKPMAQATNPTSEYIFNQSEARQVLLCYVMDAIRTALPNATERISYQMPAFYLNGRYMIAFAAMKNHLGIYPGAVAIEHFAECL
jgi:hypothetical protein